MGAKWPDCLVAAPAVRSARVGEANHPVLINLISAISDPIFAPTGVNENLAIGGDLRDPFSSIQG